MRLLLTISVAFFIFYHVLGVPTSVKIVHGDVALDGEIPYVVSIRYNNCHECGGSIISDTWVLTAAHCIFPQAINLSTVLFGTTKSHNCEQAPWHTRKVKRAIQNSRYQNYGGYFNDIALIEVEEPFLFNDLVQPIVLPQCHQETPVVSDALLAGWGYQYDNGTVPDYLQKVIIPVHSERYCEGKFTVNFSDISHICAGGYGKGQCSGDSGGPLTVNGVQYGIVSWSDKPCATSAGVLTRVASFREWIRNHSGV